MLHYQSVNQSINQSINQLKHICIALYVANIYFVFISHCVKLHKMS